MGNKNGKSKDAAKAENESKEGKQKESEGSVNVQDHLAPKEKVTDVDDTNKIDDIVNGLKATTDLDDEQCDQNVPAVKNDYKSEDKGEMENRKYANEINAEKEQNADFTGNGVVSTSEGLQIQETEVPIVSIHVAENSQAPLKMEALKEQAIVTETKINADDKVDNESNLSKPSGDTETGVNEVNTVKGTNDIKSDSIENIEEDSTANVPKEDEKATTIISEQEPSSEEIALTDNGDNVRQMDVQISEVKSLDEPIVHDPKHSELSCDGIKTENMKSVDEPIVHDPKHAELSCDGIKTENITESRQENEDKPAAITATENTIEIECIKDNLSNKNNEGDNISKTDSTDKLEATVKEEEHTTSIESDQEEVKTEVEKENLQDEKKEVSCVQHVIEPISSEIVNKISEECLETGIESGKENASEILEKVTLEFCWKDGGTDVQISGSFDNFESKMNMNKRENEFVISIDLAPGEYTYNFCVDGDWKVDANKPIKDDNAGNKKNVVVVAKQVQ